jgi:hypothetical protein
MTPMQGSEGSEQKFSYESVKYDSNSVKQQNARKSTTRGKLKY